MDFKGSSVECLKHFVGGATTRSDTVSRKRELAIYADVSIDTVSRWVKGRQKPVGLPGLKVMFFLEGKGYAVAEIKKIAEEIKPLSRLVASGAIPFDEARQKLSYEKDRFLVRLLSGKERAVPEKIKVVAEMTATAGQGLGAESAKKSRETAPLRQTVPTVGKETIIETMTYIAKMTVLFGEMVVSDEFTAEDRRKMRALAGNDTFFKASNLMSRLCSEKAREII